NTVVANVPVGQAPQALTYVPNAVPDGDGRQGLQALGVAGQTSSLTLTATTGDKSAPATSVTLFEQGLVQVLQAAVTGLAPKQPYVLALAERPDGGGTLQPLANFMTNPAGAAIVNAVGPIRQLVKPEVQSARRYLVIAAQVNGAPGRPI